MRIGTLIIAIVLVMVAIVGWSYVPLIVPAAEGAEQRGYYIMKCTNGPSHGLTRLSSYRITSNGFLVTYEKNGATDWHSSGNACTLGDLIREREE